jgi:hypothetical protein
MNKNVILAAVPQKKLAEKLFALHCIAVTALRKGGLAPSF